MVAYVVGEVIVTDDAFAEEYRPKILALIEKHGGKFVSGGTFEKLEGSRPLPDWLVIIEFPNIRTSQGLVQRSGICAVDHSEGYRF